MGARKGDIGMWLYSSDRKNDYHSGSPGTRLQWPWQYNRIRRTSRQTKNCKETIGTVMCVVYRALPLVMFVGLVPWLGLDILKSESDVLLTGTTETVLEAWYV